MWRDARRVSQAVSNAVLCWLSRTHSWALPQGNGRALGIAPEVLDIVFNACEKKNLKMGRKSLVGG
ncbi:hypothetical protein M419DRAFT_121529 [Trichoderma reesei RUT C-30]|uniref:Uncharacterized protein n=1 Tax=Hypocrea jecorina (strain ATCC 56765 / BCRC 32924 / NRRL 11460 / Rut C-30) TaxID=1344414 RepID=A0A024SK08_HYPJR|nr:hypothetical protein M419DRAFT_121529 [Trichoderma reesei RUT C-30]